MLALRDELERYGIRGELRDHVLVAMGRALRDDLILVVLWDDAGLQARNAQQGQTKIAIVNVMVAAAPGCVRCLEAPDEVFHLRNTSDRGKIWRAVGIQCQWALGDLPDAGFQPVLGRAPVGRAVVIYDSKKEAPSLDEFDSLFV